jgi:Fe-S oxidoreductase
MHDSSAAEIVLLALVMATSIVLFWRRFGAVVRRIRASKPDADFHLAPIRKRFGDFLWEVVLQGKVIRERPLPGIAHAFVFWGFCAFALVTIDHIAEGFRLDPLSEQGAFSRFYFWLAGLFAVAVSVSIVGLAIRRFLVRPRWLGEVSAESGLIAFLILTLMVTYLARFILAGDPQLARLNWWAHTLALFVFLPLIPHTKHLHLVLSPATVFLRRGGFSKIPPLVGDEDFGLDTGKDATRIVSLQAYSCVECGRCSEHCPATNTGKVLNPKQIILGVRAYLNEFGPDSSEPLIGKHISQEAVFQCTTCGGCEYQCPVGIEHLPIMVGLRRGSVNTGKWEDDYGTRLFLNLERNGNALGLASSERDKFIQRAELPYFDGSQEYCLWLGCMGAYDPQGRDIIVALARVLRHLGISFGVLKRERCSGDPARRLGNDLAFGDLAQGNLEQLRSAGVKRLVSICPHCVRTIQEDWKEYGAGVPIEHHSELLARYRAQLPTNPANGRKIVFHDPCYLGRYRDVYEAPRMVASAGGEVIDPPRARQRSFCCGAGGGLAFLGEEKGKRVSLERAEELVRTGAEVVGAACPFCNTMFRDALAGLGPNPPKLLDIAQIAAAALERPSSL